MRNEKTPPLPRASESGVRVGVLARRAELGVGKSRLAATLGAEATFAAYREMLRATAEAVGGTALPATVFFAPAIGDRDLWPTSRFAYALQVDDPDLGARIRDAAVRTLAARDPGGTSGAAALIMGTDCPYLTSGALEDAANALLEHDCVLGPSSDGGYYLIGVRADHPELFSGVEWSSERVADQTRAAMSRAGLAWTELPTLDDIDYEGDWRAYERRRRRDRPGGDPQPTFPV